MDPERYDIEIHQGARFELSVLWSNPDTTPVDLTGYTFKAQVRRSPVDDSVLAEIAIAAATPANGTMLLTIDEAVTVTMPPGDWEWDFFVVSPSSIPYKLVFGRAKVIRRVTRIP